MATISDIKGTIIEPQTLEELWNIIPAPEYIKTDKAFVEYIEAWESLTRNKQKPIDFLKNFENNDYDGMEWLIENIRYTYWSANKEKLTKRLELFSDNPELGHKMNFIEMLREKDYPENYIQLIMNLGTKLDGVPMMFSWAPENIGAEEPELRYFTDELHLKTEKEEIKLNIPAGMKLACLCFGQTITCIDPGLTANETDVYILRNGIIYKWSVQGESRFNAPYATDICLAGKKLLRSVNGKLDPVIDSPKVGEFFMMNALDDHSIAFIDKNLTLVSNNGYLSGMKEVIALIRTNDNLYAVGKDGTVRDVKGKNDMNTNQLKEYMLNCLSIDKSGFMKAYGNTNFGVNSEGNLVRVR